MKTTILILLFLTGLIFSSCIYGQNPEEHVKLGKEAAKSLLKSTLSDSTQPGMLNNKSILITDSATAIAMVEPLLFKGYGKEMILDERPYEAYLIDGYWVITGSLPEGYKGGVFEVIMDAHNGQIIRITHGK